MKETDVSQPLEEEEQLDNGKGMFSVAIPAHCQRKTIDELLKTFSNAPFRCMRLLSERGDTLHVQYPLSMNYGEHTVFPLTYIRERLRKCGLE